MSLLTIGIGKGRSLRLHWPNSHFVDFPCSEKGAELLHHVLFSYAVETSKIGSHGSPTQSMLNEWLLGEAWPDLLLAGDPKRWEEVEKATGVRVRRLDSKGYEKVVTLKDLDL